ncbi:MAG: glucose-6-phosphate dehydrogenase [Victivallales bacterium]|nr:glucose-6-phosphate dehydrogenase [Victivallales bacterium]
MNNSHDVWRGSFCIEVSPIPNTIVIFGASGDLTHRKLLPALFHLYRKKLLHENSIIVGCARTPMTDEEFKDKVTERLAGVAAKFSEEFTSFIDKVFYHTGHYDDPNTYAELALKLCKLEKQRCPDACRVYYLSTPSNIYIDIVSLLGEAGLTHESSSGMPWRHVVIEKPFGHDLKSAEIIDRQLHKTLRESQIYRIDHYLGKETVQNIMMMRFANIIFEPIWNNHYISNVQITAAESIGVEHRAGYYEQSGLLRDMFQNHMLEMLSLVAMEAPASFEANAVRNEKLKLIQSIRPFTPASVKNDFIRGQYGAGKVYSEDVPAYRAEENVAPESMIETYACGRFFIDNWRWRGVPFYIRSGKRLANRTSEIAITFKQVPHSIFNPIRPEDLSPNQLVLNIQPEEGMALSIEAKQPGPKLCMGTLTMDFKYSEVFDSTALGAYERLLLDCMLGDQTLFIRNDIIKASWELFEPVLNAWETPGTDIPLHIYESGGQGPEQADLRFFKDGLRWRKI